MGESLPAKTVYFEKDDANEGKQISEIENLTTSH